MPFREGATVKPKTVYQKKNVGEDQNKVVRLASKISNNDIDFITTIEAENGLWTLNRVSRRNSDGSYDKGLCQLNSRYHATFIKSKDFDSAEAQIKYCWNVYKNRPSSFYGWYKRKNHYNKFYIP